MPVGEWLRDLLGINRYVMVWRYNLHGRTITGDTRNHVYIGHYTRRQASRVIERMNNVYGDGTHWVERA